MTQINERVKKKVACGKILVMAGTISSTINKLGEESILFGRHKTFFLLPYTAVVVVWVEGWVLYRYMCTIFSQLLVYQYHQHIDEASNKKTQTQTHIKKEPICKEGNLIMINK